MKTNQADFKQAWSIIDNAENIFMTTHESTDGDDLGSLLATRLVLLSLGKRVTAAVKKGVPSSLKFLPGANEVADQYVPGNYDLIITFGCASIKRPGLVELEKAASIINFDHHPDNQYFGEANVVDPSTAAVAELVYYFLASRKIEITKDVATCIATGIFTDTGGFQHATTTAESLEVVARMLNKGARIDKIAAFTFGQKRPEALKAWSKAIENTRFDPIQKVAYTVLTDEDFVEIGAKDADLQGFVEVLNHIPEARFVLLLRQEGSQVKGSLRSEPSKGVDVSRIAHFFGGGGHKLSAGFKIEGQLHRVGDNWEVR